MCCPLIFTDYENGRQTRITYAKRHLLKTDPHSFQGLQNLYPKGLFRGFFIIIIISILIELIHPIQGPEGTNTGGLLKVFYESGIEDARRANMRTCMIYIQWGK